VNLSRTAHQDDEPAEKLETTSSVLTQHHASWPSPPLPYTNSPHQEQTTTNYPSLRPEWMVDQSPYDYHENDNDDDGDDADDDAQHNLPTD